MSHAAPPSPLTARRSGALDGPRARAGRQVDFAPRADLRRAGGRRDPDHRPAGGRGRASTPPRPCGRSAPPSSAPASGAWTVHGVGVGGFAEPDGAARFRQFRHRLPAGDGRGRRLPDQGDVRRRRVPAQAADAAHARSAGADGRARARGRRGGRLPLTLQGARDPIPIEYEAPVPRRSSSRRCCWPGLAAPGETTVIEKEATRDHTEQMLDAFRRGGARRRRMASTAAASRSNGQPELGPRRCVVPADPSSAAFPLVAALIVPGSEVVLEGVMINPLRTGLLTTLREMGAAIEIARAAQRRRRGRGRPAGQRVGAEGRRRAGRARALDDRRISDPGGRGGLRRRHHAHARPERIAREGIRPARRHRRRCCASTASRSRSRATT